MTYFNNLGQARVGWRIPSGGVTPSTLWNSVFSVWNADALGTSLDTNIFRVYNGDNVNDTSGNVQNGTNVNNVTFTTGKVGNAFTFNGSNYVALPNNSMNLTGDCSISFWVNVATNGTYQNILSTYYTTGGVQYGFILRVENNGGLIFNAYSGASTTTFATNPSGGAIPTNTWRHFTITKTNSQIKWYVNGIIDTTFNGTYPLSFHSSNPAAIGALYKYDGTNTAQYMSNGSKIDGLTVWNKVLTANEIFNLYNDGTGAEYPFTSQYLASLNDSIGSNHGTRPASTLTGGVPGPSFTTGKIGKAFTFDGINDYVSLPDNSMNFTGDFSISCWYYVKQINDQALISNRQKSGGNNHGWQLYYNSGWLYFYIFNGTSTISGAGFDSGFPADTWVHITLVRKAGTSTKFYINGVLRNSSGIGTVTANPVYTTNQKCSIGNTWVGTFFDSYVKNGAKIDAVSVWNRELTSSDVTELYNSGNGKQYPN